MRKIVLVIFILIAASFACLSSLDEPTLKEPSYYSEKYGGSVGAYEYFTSIEDCDILQVEFRKNSDFNDSHEPGTQAFKLFLGYMSAINDRQFDLGCP